MHIMWYIFCLKTLQFAICEQILIITNIQWGGISSRMASDSNHLLQNIAFAVHLGIGCCKHHSGTISTEKNEPLTPSHFKPIGPCHDIS